MQYRDKTEWDAGLAAQSGYGAAIYHFAERWANLMEQRMGDGATLEDVAKPASHDADTDGLTGFMYGVAVSVLSQTWVRGDELRRWHNLDIQIHDEGEKANETGATLNPALLSVGVD